MVRAAYQTAQPSILAAPQGELAFRIRGTSRDGQVVKIASTKCTVGSGARCTLRLRAVGVRPVHCLLLRSQDGTIARCWSGDTLLNGRYFGDAKLSPGDVLTVGPLELEVLDEAAANDEKINAWSPRADQSGDALVALRVRMLTLQKQSRCRIEQLVATIRDLKREIAAIEQSRVQLDRNRGPIAEERGAWESECSDRQAQLKAQWDDFQTASAELDARKQQFAHEQEVRFTDLDRRAAELERRQTELKQNWDLINEQRDALRAAGELQDADWNCRSGQLHARAAELDARAHELDHDRKELNELARTSKKQSASEQAVRAELEATRGELEVTLSRLTAAEDELEVARNQFEVDRTALVGEREHVAAARREADQRLADQTKKLAQHESDWQQHRRGWEAECAELMACVEAAESGRDCQAEAERKALSDERRRLQAEREQVQAELAAQSESLAAELAACNAERAAFEEERRASQDACNRTQAELDERAEVLEQLQAVLSSRGKILDEREAGAATEQTSAAATDELTRELEDRERALEASHCEAQSRLDESQAELESQRAELAARKQQFELEQAENTMRLEQRTTELDNLTAELAEKQAELASQPAPAQNDQQAQLEEISARQRALGAEREAWEREKQQSEAANAATIQELMAQLEQLREHLGVVEGQRSSGVESVEPHQPAAETNTEDRPVRDTHGDDVAATPTAEEDAFARLRGLSLLREETQAPSAPAAAEPAEKVASARQVPSAPASSAEPSEEESIDQYMARLLNRVRTGTESSSTAESQESSRARARASRQAVVDEETVVEAPKAPVPAPEIKAVKVEPVEFVPRGAPPEASELKRMREVANFTTRAAITKHGNKRWALNSLLKWTIAAFVVSASLAGMQFAPAGDKITRIIAVAGLAVGCYWVWAALVATKPALDAIQKKFGRQPVESPTVAAAPEARDEA